MVFDQQRDLLFQITFEQVGTGNRRRVGARARDMPKTEPTVSLCKCRRAKTNFGVEGPKPRVWAGPNNVA